MIVESLKNFDVLFAEASNDEKRALLRALIKEIHMEADRKSIKNIVFWFAEDDSLSQFALPVSDVRGTVSQILVKWRMKLMVDLTEGKRHYS